MLTGNLNISSIDQLPMQRAAMEKNKIGSPRSTIAFLYIAGVSEEISKIFNPFDIRVAFRAVTTICTKITG